MIHLDTFSGIGAWALAARWMGWETVAFVEKDTFCQKVLNKNFPGVPIHDDIFTFSGKPFRGRIGTLTASTPCQPFSAAGKRQGSNDERHLFPELLRVVAEVQPEWVIIENVYGLLNIESGQVFEDYNTSLEGEGYSVQTLCIPASALNAPHRRDRLWIVAHAIKSGAGRKDGAVTDQSGHTGKSRGAGIRQGNRAIGTGWTYSTDSDASDATDERCIGRGEQGQGSERQIHPGRGNDRTLCELELDSEFDAENSVKSRPRIRTAEKSLCVGIERNAGSGNAERLHRESRWTENWPTVAARLCGVDARLPDELHIVGSRDNRVNRLKALGNSIVPQIAYEIFKAIATSHAPLAMPSTDGNLKGDIQSKLLV